MVLGWQRPGRVGRRRIPINDYGESKDFSESLFLSSSMAEHSAVNRVVVSSSLTWGAKSSDSKESELFLYFNFKKCYNIRTNSLDKEAKDVYGRPI